MRTYVFAAAAALTFGFMSTAPAQATYWACMGGYVACGDSGSSTSKSSGKAASRKTAKYYSDDSGDDYVPMKKKARKAKVVSSDDEDDDTPKGKRRVTYSGGEGRSAGGGMASYYWQPQRVASGGWFNPNALTAAHKTLPFGTRVRVTNRHNGQSVVVTINDRGPYVAGRVIDLSSRAAGEIGMKGAGVVPVSMSVLGR